MALNKNVKVVFVACLLAGLVWLGGCDETGESDGKNKKVETAKKISTTQDPAAAETGKQGSTAAKQVELKTTAGVVVIELNEKAAPVTVKNFLTYVEEGFYNGTIFHRVITNFMIQGGGFTVDMSKKQTYQPIVNEAANGLKNDRGTIAMARTNNPDSASSQFFINHKDNAFLNYTGPNKPGYAVFGRVIKGMDVVDAIAGVKTTSRKGMSNVPVEPVVIKSAGVISGKAK